MSTVCIPSPGPKSRADLNRLMTLTWPVIIWSCVTIPKSSELWSSHTPKTRPTTTTTTKHRHRHTHTLTHKCTHTLKIYYHRINKQLSSHLHLIKCYYLFKHIHTHTHFVVAYCIVVIENISISKDD